jgi:hypothetical protein
VHIEPKIALDCPCCGEPIFEPLSWFKKTYSTCPACDNGLSAGQFTTVLADFEQALDENIEEMINGQAHSNCCGKESDSSGDKESSCCSGSSCC